VRVGTVDVRKMVRKRKRGSVSVGGRLGDGGAQAEARVCVGRLGSCVPIFHWIPFKGKGVINQPLNVFIFLMEWGVFDRAWFETRAEDLRSPRDMGRAYFR
jgi:hypothetical protein